MEVANALAYYDTVTITAVKSFIVQAPDVNVIKLFYGRNHANVSIRQQFKINY
jgi:hypothetical protein